MRTVTDPGARGSILDASGHVVVGNQLVTSIEIKRGIPLTQLNTTVHNLAKLLNTSDSAVWQQVHNPKLTAYQPIPIANRIDYPTLVSIKERPEEFPGVIAAQASQRVYPDQNLAAHLLGYVGAVNGQDLQLHPGEHYTAEDVIGKDGVEQVFEDVLRGTPHIRRLEVDSRGRVVSVLSDKPATTGNDVKLTMDTGVQAETENALNQGIQEVRGMRDTSSKTTLQNFRAPGGSAVVLDAKTGSVVALASYPNFPISQFTNGISGADLQQYTSPLLGDPLLNRVTQGQYPPGSTFKLMTSIAAVVDGAVVPGNANYSFEDNGCIKFGSAPNYQQFCNAGKTPHGIVDLPHAIEVSSDVYFYNLGFRFYGLWNCGDITKITCSNSVFASDKVKGYGIQNTAKEFGFGKPTGSGLPQEAPGRVPDLEFKRALNRNNPTADQFSNSWLPDDSANVATGQGDVLATPLQLADAYATFINGGNLYAPRLASQIMAPDAKTAIRNLPPQLVRKIDIPDDVKAQIMPGLVGAVSASDGTAKAAFNGYSGLPIAGKTGTAQNPPPTQDTSWFVGLVNPNPTDPTQPQYVVVVNVEQAGFGGTVAAPIARRIIETLNGNPTPAPVQIAPPQTD
jgi:penicillin-binding protein 2